MKKQLIFSVVFVIIVVLLAALYMNTEEEEKVDTTITQITMPNHLSFYIENLSKIDTYKTKQETTMTVKIASKEIETVSDEGRPYIESVEGLVDDAVLDFMWEQSIQNDIAYTLLLAMAKVESDFIIDAVSNTGDSGILQINNNTGKWISEELGIDNIDYFNFEQNIEMGIFYLSHLRDYWRKQEASEEAMYELIITGYNAGLKGSQGFIQSNGWGKHPYFLKVDKWKQTYEQEMVELNEDQ